MTKNLTVRLLALAGALLLSAAAAASEGGDLQQRSHDGTGDDEFKAWPHAMISSAGNARWL